VEQSVFSFFTDVKYVGYKTEPQLREYLEDGTWNRAYLAEYDAESERLTLAPMGKSIWFRVGSR
jgi:hypothetical protein